MYVSGQFQKFKIYGLRIAILLFCCGLNYIIAIHVSSFVFKS